MVLTRNDFKVSQVVELPDGITLLHSVDFATLSQLGEERLNIFAELLVRGVSVFIPHHVCCTPVVCKVLLAVEPIGQVIIVVPCARCVVRDDLVIWHRLKWREVIVWLRRP